MMKFFDCTRRCVGFELYIRSLLSVFRRRHGPPGPSHIKYYDDLQPPPAPPKDERFPFLDQVRRHFLVISGILLLLVLGLLVGVIVLALQVSSKPKCPICTSDDGPTMAQADVTDTSASTETPVPSLSSDTTVAVTTVSSVSTSVEASTANTVDTTNTPLF